MAAESALFIRGGAIGDFVLSLPLLRAVRRAQPSAHIEVLGYPRIAGLALGPQCADTVRRLDSIELVSLFGDGQDLDAGAADYISRFGRIVLVWSDRRGQLGRNLAQAGARHLIAVDPFPPEGTRVHVCDHVAQQITAQGIPCEERSPRIAVQEQWRAAAEEWLEAAASNQDEHARVFAVHPGSGGRAKTWPAERFAGVISHLLQERGARVWLLWGPADRDVCRAVLAHVSAREACRVSVLRERPLTEVAALLESCDLYIGNDSGITHVAAAVGTPTVALFGPTDPCIWGPRGEHATILQGPAEIGPIEAIDLERVTEAVNVGQGSG